MDTPAMRPGTEPAEGNERDGAGPVLLDEAQAARILRVSRRTLQNWRQRGGGPPYVKLGTVVRYRLADLRAHIVASIRGARTRGRQ